MPIGIIPQNDTVGMLAKVLDASALRHRVLAGNLANSDTPGYVRKDVPFEADLASAVRSQDMRSFAPTVSEDRDTPGRTDGNNVSIEHEMAEMNKNMMLHQLGLQLLGQKLAGQRMAITGRV